MLLNHMHRFKELIEGTLDIYLAEISLSLWSKLFSFYTDSLLYRENGFSSVGEMECNHLIKFFDASMEKRLYYSE